MTNSETIHITVAYKERGWEVTESYALPKRSFNEAELWHVQMKDPSALDLRDWLLRNGAMLDQTIGPARCRRRAEDGVIEEECYLNGIRHREDGPAIVERRPDGSFREVYYRNGKLDRQDGPAIVEHTADGLIREEYYHDGHPDRQDGPASVEIWPDGSGRETFYDKGKLTKIVPLPPLNTIPGVSVQRGPLPPNPKV